MKGKTILLISPESWGNNFVSKHHYANYLAKENKVYFLNPANGYSKNPFGTVNCILDKVKENLTVVSYVNLLPKLNNLPKSVQKSTYKKQALQILKAIDDPIDLVWSFDPFRFFDQEVWNCEQTIYHTVDFHPDANYEKDMVLSSNHFFGVTDWVLKDHLSYREGILVTHAADLDGFQQLPEVEIPGKNKIRACYVGNLHKHIDYGILEEMTTENPDVDFIIIGPIENSNLSSGNKVDEATLQRLKSYENIHFIGSVPPEKLMGYLTLCDINLVLFKKEHEKIHCSPHKLMGYFYSGNVTLSNYIDAHKSTPSDIITMINNQADIPEHFKAIKSNLVFHNSPELKEKRRNFAEANAYTTKIAQINQTVFPND